MGAIAVGGLGSAYGDLQAGDAAPTPYKDTLEPESNESMGMESEEEEMGHEDDEWATVRTMGSWS